MYFRICHDYKHWYFVLIFIVIAVIVSIIMNLKEWGKLMQLYQNNKIENSRITVSNKLCEQNRTLVIVNGQVRTIGHVWEALLLNVVQPNEPCDIIFSIDGKRDDIPNSVLAGLGSRIIAILTTENEKSEGLTEFWLMKRTIRKIHVDRYHFILKTRTDLYHGIPIRLRTIFGENDDFLPSFHSFHQTLMTKTTRTNYSAEEVLYSWFMTAGMIEFIPTMLMKKPYSPWAKLHQHEWNQNLRSTLKNCTINENMTTITDNVKNEEKILHCFKLAFVKHKIVYNIGSTWIQFGHSKHMAPTAIQIAEEFGTHTWAAFGFSDSDTLGHGQWKHVTETQMRLTFLNHSYNLIDLVNGADYRQTFHKQFTFEQAKLNKQFLFFIVRKETIT